MRKFKELVQFVAEASRAGVAKYQAKHRDSRPVWVPDSGAAFGSRESTYGDQTAAAARIENAGRIRDKVKAAAAAEGKAKGEAKARAAAELAARISKTKSEAGANEQIESLRPGETLGVDLVDGGFGYVHHHQETKTKYFAKGNNEKAHPIHSVEVHPDHLKITTMKTTGKNRTKTTLANVHHRDATPVKSGGIDRRTGAFTTQHDLNT
jgi:hypothetical protein